MKDVSAYYASTGPSDVCDSGEVYTPSQPSSALSVKSELSDPFVEFEDDYSEENWDGSGAVAIGPDTISSARAFHRSLDSKFCSGALLSISPGADGTIGFEWIARHGPTRKLFIEVRHDTLKGYWVSDGGKIEKFPARLMRFATCAYEIEKVIAEICSRGE